MVVLTDVITISSLVSSLVAVLSFFFAVSAKRGVANSKALDDKLTVKMNDLRISLETQMEQTLGRELENRIDTALEKFKNALQDRMGSTYVPTNALELRFRVTDEALKQLEARVTRSQQQTDTVLGQIDHRLTRTQEQVTMCLEHFLRGRRPIYDDNTGEK